MSTLPTNTTFLPVLDDLLSPDFRTVSLPGQTPQTPAETPGTGKVITFVESHTGQLTSKTSNYPGVINKDNPTNTGGVGGENPSPHKKDIMSTSIMSSSSSSTSHHMNGVKSSHGGGGHYNNRRHHNSPHHSHQSAAVAIQKWWKVRKSARRHSTGGGDPGGASLVLDVRAERAKHSIRHNRTEEHVRFLETEVHRLKSALATERKLRSLQVEAIRSLWSQVQKVTSASPGQQQQQQGDVMSQSMPNGLPFGGGGNNRKGGGGGGCMSMSVQGTLLDHQSLSQSDLMSCSCSKEIQDLKESFSSEVSSLRKMIDQLKVDGGSKRPLTLNLSGGSGRPGSATTTKDESSLLENVEEGVGKKEISGYADQMASSIIEDAKEQEDNNE